MPKAYAVFLPLLSVWLALSIFLAWGAVQDDSFIHLRYAANLAQHHFITYDGVHRNYGVSSLLYVSILGVLRRLTASPDLAHAVSSFLHVALVVALAAGLLRRVASASALVSGLGLLLLVLLCTPSAVRWMDDGMETGMTIGMTCLLAWLIHARHEDSLREAASSLFFVGLLAMLAFFAVLLRVELLQLCLFGTLIFLADSLPKAQLRDDAAANFEGGVCSLHSRGISAKEVSARMVHILPLAVGGALAVLVILGVMHAPLPDTALAKMHGLGHWPNVLRDTASTLAGAMSFGAGILLFWMVTLGVLLSRAGGLETPTVLANALFPVLLAVSVIRGQEIQGVRYFAWTFFFSIIWNILELADLPVPALARSGERVRERMLVFVFAGLLVVELPFEAVAMRRVLTQRAATLTAFELQHLEHLREMRGVASDIGFIGYFTGAKLCDLAGLVNGRAAAQLSSAQRTEACAAGDPDFLFVNASQFEALNLYRDFSQWQVCGRYDFTNVSTLDSHFLIVRPELTGQVCNATGESPQPSSNLLGAQPNRVAAARLAGEQP